MSTYGRALVSGSVLTPGFRGSITASIVYHAAFKEYLGSLHVSGREYLGIVSFDAVLNSASFYKDGSVTATGYVEMGGTQEKVTVSIPSTHAGLAYTVTDANGNILAGSDAVLPVVGQIVIIAPST